MRYVQHNPAVTGMFVLCLWMTILFGLLAGNGDLAFKAGIVYIVLVLHNSLAFKSIGEN